jgi:tetratricopeptide (TPR) repeat protein
MLSKPQFLKKFISFAVTKTLLSPSLRSFSLQKTIRPSQFLRYYNVSSCSFSSFRPLNNYKDDLVLISGLSREQLAYANKILDRYATSQNLDTFDQDEMHWITTILQHFATAYKAQGNLAKAYSYIKEVEGVFKDQNINDTFEVANNHFIKSSLCLNLNDTATDIEYHFNEVDRICKLLRNDPEARSLGVQNLLTRADYHKRRNEQDKAFKFFNELLEKKAQALDDVLPHLLIPTYEELGFIYKFKGEPLKAIDSWIKGLEVAIPHLGENSKKVFFFYCDLAEILYQGGRPEQAIHYINKAFQVALNVYPTDHREIGWCNYMLGNILNANGNPDKALETYRKAIKIYEMQTQVDFGALSDAYFKAALINQNEQEASLFFSKSIEMLAKSQTPNMEESFLYRARELKQQKRWKEYETYLKEALEYCKKYKPSDKQKIGEINILLEELAAQEK